MGPRTTRGVRPGSILALSIAHHENIARWKKQLDTLAANLAIGAALCASFDLGLYNTDCGNVHPSVTWKPGCQRPAP